MGVRVAWCLDDCGGSLGVDGEYAMGLIGGLDGVYGALQVALHPVFHSDRERQGAYEFAVNLAFGCASSNGAVGNEIFQVGGYDWIEEFSSAGQIHLVYLREQTASDTESVVGSGYTGEVGIVDESLPSNDAAGLFEIGPHYDGYLVFDGFGETGESPSVFHRSVDVVNGAGAADD